MRTGQRRWDGLRELCAEVAMKVSLQRLSSNGTSMHAQKCVTEGMLMHKTYGSPERTKKYFLTYEKVHCGDAFIALIRS